MVNIAADGTIRTENVVPSPDKVVDILQEVEQKEQADVIEGDIKAFPTDDMKNANKNDGKLVLAEEIKEGHLTWRSFKLLLSGIGGKRPILFFTAWIIVLFIADFINIGRAWYLGYWGSQYEIHAPSEVDVNL